ncbi:MAG: arylamine N-acetyltransferase [Pseudomonadota bacterium]
MDDQQFDTNAYLKRIGYAGTIEPTFDVLKAIHRAQHFAIPFENFDIALGKAIDLRAENLFHKLVHNRRGGYCFELNGLLLRALQVFGFDARALLGRVHLTGVPSGRGHQISLVTIEGRQWIVDVGFGSGTPRAPVPFVFDQEVSAHGQTVRLIESESFGTMLQMKNGEDWDDLYSFDLEHVCAGDIAYGNHYTSTSPNSFFARDRVAAIPVKGGGITLLNDRLTKSVDGKLTTTQLETGHPYIDALKTHFGIELDACYDDLKPIGDDPHASNP